MHSKDEYDKMLNVRVTTAFHEAMVDCANSLNEIPAVFIRTAINNRMMEQGVFDFHTADTNPWINHLMKVSKEHTENNNKEKKA